MINLRKANLNESEEILNFYRNTVSAIKNSEFKPKWNDEYPNLDFIKKSISKEELYIYKENNTIISSIVINNEFNEEYKNIDWSVDAKSNEVTIIHAFAINSDFMGRGFGKKIFNQIKENALNNNQKSIRIDIIDGNEGAKSVFEHLGFEYVDTMEIFHNAVGLEKFYLYEYILKK